MVSFLVLSLSCHFGGSTLEYILLPYKKKRINSRKNSSLSTIPQLYMELMGDRIIVLFKLSNMQIAERWLESMTSY